MTNRPYMIYSAINIGNSENGICVPVFSHSHYNELFVPVTDSLLKIVDFKEFHGFNDRQFVLPYDLDIQYYYVPGACLPILALDRGRIVAVDGADIYETFQNLLDIKEISGEIVSEIIFDIERILHSARPAIDHQDHVPDWLDPNLEPKGSKFWLDNAITELRSAGSRPITSDQSGAVRLKLLAWAKDLGEHATTPIFRHFLSAAKIAERAGVKVDDIVATALLRRMTEGIPREDSAVMLVGNFRQRYERGPLQSVIELSQSGKSEFSSRALKVLSEYYSYIDKNLKANSRNRYGVLSAAYAADSSDQWPPHIKEKLISCRKDYLDSTLKDINKHQSMVKNFNLTRTRIREKVRQGFKTTDVDRFAVRSQAQKLLASADNIQKNIEMIDMLSKSLSGNVSQEYRKRSTGIDYRLIGLNEDLMTSIFGTLNESYLMDVFG